MSQDNEKPSSSPKKLEKKITLGGILLGRLALLRGYITSEQLVESLEAQKTLRKQGKPHDLEDVFLRLSYLKAEQVEKLKNLLKEPKHRLIGKYLIIREIGSGAMGVVFLARDKFTKRSVAVKVLPPSLAKNHRFVERFKREASATFNLEHKNLVQSFGLHRSGDFYYFAMEFIDGCNLREVINKEKIFEEKIALEIVREITKALVYADRRGLVHRDIKPDNIMITRDGVIKLCDLGLAKFLESDSSLTQTGRAVGTPHYLSPEQARGEVDVDIRSDIYGLGVNFYLMVVGKLPFNGPTAPVVLKKHILDPPTPPKKINPGVSTQVETMILKMMEKKKEHRYQKPTELLREVDRLLNKGGIFQVKKKTSPSPAGTSYTLPVNLRPKKSRRTPKGRGKTEKEHRHSETSKKDKKDKKDKELSTKINLIIVLILMAIFNVILLVLLFLR